MRTARRPKGVVFRIIKASKIMPAPIMMCQNPSAALPLITIKVSPLPNVRAPAEANNTKASAAPKAGASKANRMAVIAATMVAMHQP